MRWKEVDGGRMCENCFIQHVQSLSLDWKDKNNTPTRTLSSQPAWVKRNQGWGKSRLKSDWFLSIFHCFLRFYPKKWWIGDENKFLSHPHILSLLSCSSFAWTSHKSSLQSDLGIRSLPFSTVKTSETWRNSEMRYKSLISLSLEAGGWAMESRTKKCLGKRESLPRGIWLLGPPSRKGWKDKRKKRDAFSSTYSK